MPHTIRTAADQRRWNAYRRRGVREYFDAHPASGLDDQPCAPPGVGRFAFPF